jgi:hypothetical protein
MDIFRIAARVSEPEACPVCGDLMLYDDGRDAYTCNCGFAEANGPSGSTNLEKVAAAIAARSSSGVSCTADLSISVNFEGQITNQTLTSKLKSEFLAAIKSAIDITAREMHLKFTEIQVEPLSVEIVSIPTNKP